MSALNTTADGIKTVLEAVAELEGIGIVVDRQKNVAARISEAVARAGGNAITIFFEGYDVPDVNAQRRVRASYSIKTYSLPIIENAKKPVEAERLYADDVIEIIHKALHQYTPPVDGKAMPNAIGEMQVSGADFVPDARWLVYELTVSVPISL